MIYLTGDTHRKFSRLNYSYGFKNTDMSKDDYLIICGDFGGIWLPNLSEEILNDSSLGYKKYLEVLNPDFDWSKECPDEKELLDRLENYNFTILFVTGNHENFDRLRTYPDKEWHGGVVKEIRPHVLLLKRGYIFDIDGYKFFTMGGAKCHDIHDGVFELDDPEFEDKVSKAMYYRVNHLSWWKEEVPNEEERQRAIDTLEANNWTVDFVLTHEAPNRFVRELSYGRYRPDEYSEWLQMIQIKLNYKHWFFGHYHTELDISKKDHCLYEWINSLGYYLDTDESQYMDDLWGTNRYKEIINTLVDKYYEIIDVVNKDPLREIQKVGKHRIGKFVTIERIEPGKQGMFNYVEKGKLTGRMLVTSFVIETKFNIPSFGITTVETENSIYTLQEREYIPEPEPVSVKEPEEDIDPSSIWKD